jgi:hypothetical protein
MFERFFRDFKVSNQISKPMIMVKTAQTTVKYPPNFSQPLVIGITTAGTVIKKVKKTMTAFPMAAIFSISIHSIISSRENPPFNGHILKSRSRATLSSVGVELISDLTTRAKIMSSPPAATNSKSMTTYVMRMLSLILAVFRDDLLWVFILYSSNDDRRQNPKSRRAKESVVETSNDTALNKKYKSFLSSTGSDNRESN